MFKIIVVDDSAVMRQFVERALGMTGFALQTYLAADGREAVRIANGILPDLIITDLNMPGVNGEELVALLEAEPSLRNIPVIVITADGAKARVKSLLSHKRVIACLMKPVRPEELRQHLERLIDGEVLCESGVAARGEYDD